MAHILDFYCKDKDHDQKQFGRKEFTWFTKFLSGPPSGEARGDEAGPDLKQRPWIMKQSADYRLAPPGLLNLLSFTTQGYLPRGDITHKGLGLSH